VLWRLKLGIFRLNFRVYLEWKGESDACATIPIMYSGVLTFLNDGGMATPGGTEKQRPRWLRIQYIFSYINYMSDLTVSLTRTMI
jgi:hypothetical protein